MACGRCCAPCKAQPVEYRRGYATTEGSHMTRLKVLLGVFALLAVGIGGSSALAKPPGKVTCTSGAIAPGVYGALTVTGACTITGDVTINGKVTVAKGADLEGSFLGTRLTINGNVQAKRGATLGLGCSFGFH